MAITTIYRMYTEARNRSGTVPSSVVPADRSYASVPLALAANITVQKQLAMPGFRSPKRRPNRKGVADSFRFGLPQSQNRAGRISDEAEPTHADYFRDVLHHLAA